MQIILTVFFLGDNPLRSETEVSIRVINKNMPVFAQQFYSVSIPESLKPHSPVVSIMASSPQNRKLIYAIVDGDVYEEFIVDYDTGKFWFIACSIFCMLENVKTFGV